MAKAEEKDLQILIQSLDKQTVKLFKNKLESSNQKDSIIKKTLFDAFYKTIQFDKNKFIKEHQINIRKFNSLKFDLFRDVINHLKNNYPKYSYTALQNEVMELVLLVNRGLYVKAIRKVHLIKQIAKSKYDYDTFCFVQRIVIDFKLYNHTNTFGNFSKACKDLKKYEKFSKNLSGHLLLNYKVLNISQ